MNLVKISMFLILIMILGMVSIIGLPVGPLSAEKRASFANEWGPFQTDGGVFLVPPGWAAIDPYRPVADDRGLHWLPLEAPGGSRVAYLRTIDRTTEAFLIHGPRPALSSLIRRSLEKYERNPLVELIDPMTVSTAESIEVRCRRIQVQESGGQGAGRAWLLGYAELGDWMFVVDAGGQAGSFAADAVEEIIRGVRMPEPLGNGSAAATARSD